MAGQRSLRGLRQWSRLGERCTPGQPAHSLRVPRWACSRAQGSRLGASCVCIDVPVAKTGAVGAKGVIREEGDACACMSGWHLGRSSGPPLSARWCRCAPLPTALRAIGITTNNDVRKGGVAAALVDGGVVKGRQCACACTSKHTHF